MKKTIFVVTGALLVMGFVLVGCGSGPAVSTPAVSAPEASTPPASVPSASAQTEADLDTKVDGTNANGINEEEAAPTTISEPKKIDFAESPRFSRKVVSYKLKGEECVEDIDRVELTWRHETESWLPPLSEWWEYDESNLSEFEKNYTETYNSILTNPGEAYTLEMVIYLKDGKSATLTFKGGYYRDFGNDGYMRWNWIDGTLVSVSSVWSFNGSIIWLTRRDNYLYMADYCEINSYSITFTAEEITYKPAGESNIMRFCIGQTEEAQIEIVLDGSFFPD